MNAESLKTTSAAVLIGALAAACAVDSDEAIGKDEANVRTHAAVDSEGRAVLPNWATDEEVADPRNDEPTDRVESAPPAAGFRVPAEYEPVRSVVMTWAGHPSVLSGISVASAAAGAEVWMVGGPTSLAGVPANRYRALPYAYNSIWSRDYGPVGINDRTGALAIVDTTYRHHAVRRADDALSCTLADLVNAECHRTGLILDGGNYMSDGRGNVFLTRRVYDWNNTLSRGAVDQLLKTYLHAETVNVIDYAVDAAGNPADGTGHIDMFAKLVADCKVLVAQTTVEPYRTVTDKAAAFFAGTTCAQGRRYEVTRVKGWTRGRTWYTYTNSLLVNGTAIIPFYDNNTANNEEARAAYRAALPGYEVVGVNSEATIVQGGSIHCITKEIPVAR